MFCVSERKKYLPNILKNPVLCLTPETQTEQCETACTCFSQQPLIMQNFNPKHSFNRWVRSLDFNRFSSIVNFLLNSVLILKY